MYLWNSGRIFFQAVLASCFFNETMFNKEARGTSFTSGYNIYVQNIAPESRNPASVERDEKPGFI